MAHDIFISYSSRDKPITEGVCANLESADIRCWIAPRDIATLTMPDKPDLLYFSFATGI